MIPRTYTLPDKTVEESNNDWIARAVASIPDDALRAIADEYAWAIKPMWRDGPIPNRPAWPIISDITGHGAGVSAAIAERLGLGDDQGPTP